MNDRVLIAPAGWEDRYLNGVLTDIKQFSPTTILVPSSAGYKRRTTYNRDAIKNHATRSGITYIEEEINYCDSVELYLSLSNIITDSLKEATSARFNATTTPRDAIWNILHFISIIKTPTEFSYYRPKSYGAYLSRDAKPPQLVLKRSGVSFPDRPTCILVLDGFDAERRAQLRNRYEPKLMLIGCQTGDQLENTTRKASNLLPYLDGEHYFDFDCFDTSEKSLKVLEEHALKYIADYNVIAASLGPKPSALTLFNLNRKIPDVGLVYIPAGDYSENYSSGFDESENDVATITW